MKIEKALYFVMIFVGLLPIIDLHINERTLPEVLFETFFVLLLTGSGGYLLGRYEKRQYLK